MLKRLYIKNFTLIEQLDIPFSPGFSVITGETGAGKSIVLGAIGLLIGQRADSKMIKQGKEKCIVEAEFDLSNYDMQSFFSENDIEYDAADCIIRRELTQAGKSRAFINDTPVPLSALKELGETLMDIHSQHQNLLLNKHDFQLSVLDIIGKSAKALDNYREAYRELQSKRERRATVEAEVASTKKQADFLQFQFNELDQANLADDEQEQLEQQLDLLNHSEEIKSALYEASGALNAEQTGAVETTRRARNAIERIAGVMPKAEETKQRLDSCLIELKDLADELSTQMDDIDFDPQEQNSIEQRLDLIYTLEKKYDADSVAQLIDQRDRLKKQLSELENSDELLAQLTEEVAVAEADCRDKAQKLSLLRQKAATKIEQEMKQRLVPLGMPNVRFKVEIAQTDLGRNGADEVEFLFSANTSTQLQPVAQVASGGEISRVMLALKAMISGAVKLPTIIFDEIDTGVSGKIAEQMGKIMSEMGSEGRQVISITHLPQIAALGRQHYKVMKRETPDGTESQMTQLSPNERIAEIAQMLSGSDVSEAAISNAKALLHIGD